MPTNPPRSALPILLAVFVTLAALSSFAFPLGEAPDEVSHWGYIQYVSRQWAMPRPEGAALGQAHQPPLYYWLGAVVTAWIPQSEFEPIANPDFAFDEPSTPNMLLHPRKEGFPYQDSTLVWHLFRLFSVVMGATTVWATGRIALLIVPQDPWISLASAAFVALLPSFTFLSAVVNNDNLVIMLSSLGIYEILLVAQRPYRWLDSIVLGVIVGLAALAKLSGLVLGLFALISLVAIAWKRREWMKGILHAVLAGVIASFLFAPWLLYNWMNYGDPLAWKLMLLTTPLREMPLSPNDLIYRIIPSLYTSFWGRFGGALHLRLADLLYGIFGVLPLLALVGWVNWARQLRSRSPCFNGVAVLATFMLYWLIMLVAFARWTLAFLGIDQSRQLFPGLPLLAVALMLGLAQLVPAQEKVVLTIAIGGLLLVNVGAIAHFAVVFAPSPAAPSSLESYGALPSPADFGHTIGILDYRITPSAVSAGDEITVTVNWQALSSPQEDYWFLLQLVGTETVATKEGVPSAGRVTTDWWKTGQQFVSSHKLVIPPSVTPGTYALRIGLHPFGKWEWLPVNGQDMLMLGKIKIATPR